MDTQFDAFAKHGQSFKTQEPLKSLANIHQQYQDVLDGQKYIDSIVWTAIQDKKSGDIPKTIQQTCLDLLIHLDAETNKDGEIVTQKPDFRAGCIEQLLIYLDPKLFSRDINMAFRSGILEMYMGQEVKFGSVNNEQFCGKELLEHGSMISKVLAAISPVTTIKPHLEAPETTFTVNDKLEAYLAVMKAIDDGKLSLSDKMTPLEQKRMLAERVMFYMKKENLPKKGNSVIEEIESLIQSSAAEKAAKKIAGFFADKSEQKTIQRQFREYEPCPESRPRASH
jgi:hypothetical protein